MEWSNQQESAIKDIRRWLKDPSQHVYRLFGYAGTGKTTLAKESASNTKNVLYSADTGKAAQVMRSKGCVGASTLHSLIKSLYFVCKISLNKKRGTENPFPSQIIIKSLT